MEGNTGWILEDKPVGEIGLKDTGGGGVADVARGEEWLDGSGDNAGEDGRGEFCSADGLPAGRGEGRWRLMLCAPEPDSSTSCKSDCRKLGAPGSMIGCRRGIGLASLEDC